VHSAVAPLLLSPSPVGSVTTALSWEASPAPCEIVALKGTRELFAVAPTPPIVAESCGLNGSLSQSVGVKELVADAVLPA
jgi:hypothetical protein